MGSERLPESHSKQASFQTQPSAFDFFFLFFLFLCSSCYLAYQEQHGGPATHVLNETPGVTQQCASETPFKVKHAPVMPVGDGDRVF